MNITNMSGRKTITYYPPEEEKFQEVNKKNIKEMIEKTIFAASNDETRVNLNGVFFEKIIRPSFLDYE